MAGKTTPVSVDARRRQVRVYKDGVLIRRASRKRLGWWRCWRVSDGGADPKYEFLRAVRTRRAAVRYLTGPVTR